MTTPRLADRLRGLIPPVITPLDEHGGFDAASAERLYRYLVDCGAHGLFLCGSSGEGPWLADETRLASIEMARRTIGDLPLLVGALAPATDAVIEQARQARDRGADAVVVCPPYYFRVTPAEVLEHFRAVRGAVDLPIVAYDIPVTTHVKIELETMLTLAAEGTIIAAKDSSGDAVGFRRLIDRCPEGFCLFTGCELLIDAVLLAGADGSVPGLANVAPALFVDLFDHWWAGRPTDAIAVQSRIAKLFDVFVCDDGSAAGPAYAIGSMKIAMYLRGLIATTRLSRPFASPTPEHQERVRTIMTELGVL